MRTTIDLPERLVRRAKSVAASRGETLRDFFLTAIGKEIPETPPKNSVRVKLPLIKSKNPGALALTNAEIETLLA